VYEQGTFIVNAFSLNCIRRCAISLAGILLTRTWSLSGTDTFASFRSSGDSP